MQNENPNTTCSSSVNLENLSDGSTVFLLSADGGEIQVSHMASKQKAFGALLEHGSHSLGDSALSPSMSFPFQLQQITCMSVPVIGHFGKTLSHTS